MANHEHVERLFIYGSLQPGGPNEHVLQDVAGEWEPAVIKGSLVEEGWGASIGYPGLRVCNEGEDVNGYVLSSSSLNSMWDYLDEFEGKEYQRTTAMVTLSGGVQVQAHVYILRP